MPPTFQGFSETKRVIMKNETKLKRLKDWMDENGIRYVTPKRCGRTGHSDLYLPERKVCVKIDGDDHELFYQRHKRYFFPVFIRDAEAPKFIIEKVQKTVIHSMMKEQERLMKKN